MSADPELEQINPLTEKIIGCAIEVHRCLGAGLLEQTYERAMCLEMERRGIAYERQAIFPIVYKGTPISEHRVDFDRGEDSRGRTQKRRTIRPDIHGASAYVSSLHRPSRRPVH
jgi:hypothetical protein